MDLLFSENISQTLTPPLAVGAGGISRQYEIVDKLARHGLSSVLASSLLGPLNTLQGLLQAERQRNRGEIAE